MKIALKCSNPLLERTLRLFYPQQICGFKDCDVIISDEDFKHHKAVFKICENGHLSMPFSKQQLDSALEEFVLTSSWQSPVVQGFEARLDEILARFKKDILALVNENR